MFKIIEMSARLPGPLAGALMQQQGDQVTRLEISDRPDPFKNQSPDETLFNFWYGSFSAGKEIVTCPDDQKGQLLLELAPNHHGLILSHHLSNQQIITQLKDGFKESLAKKSFVVLELCSSKDHRPIHDINALAESKMLAWHLALQADSAIPFAPFLPVAGVYFANQIATRFYRLLAQAAVKKEFLHERIYLDQANTNLSSLLFPAQDPIVTLHSGAFPCYGVYQLKENKYLAVGAIEPHFWKTFVELFGMPQFLHQQFDKSPSIKSSIAQQLQSFPLEKIREIVADNSACLSLI